MKLGIPYVMCINNDDATRNGNKCNNMMKKIKCLKRKKENKKRRK
jgi:hypothetical protein